MRILIVAQVFVCGFLITACAPESRFNRSTIHERLTAYTGSGLIEHKEPGHFDLPPGISRTDTLTEDKTVAIALWNNAQFQADLAAMSIAEADVVDAGTIPNPTLRYLAPNAGIVAQGYLTLALDFILQRPKRIASAQSEAERTAAMLLRKGYTLIRDALVAHTDLMLARERARMFEENVKLRTQLSHISNVREHYGDISELEASIARVDSASAADDMQRAILDTLTLRSRLLTLLGLPASDTLIHFRPSIIADSIALLPMDSCVAIALTYQPELDAARAAIEAVGERIGLEKSKILSLTAVLNYQHVSGTAGTAWLPNAVNPGLQIELPILNRNEGKIRRARAELEQASFQYIAIRQRIIQDVTEAYYRCEQIWRSYRIWSMDMLPPLEHAVDLVLESYQRGEISYVPVLEAMRQLLNGKLRTADVEAEFRRSIRQLNYTIGRGTTHE